MMLYPVNLRLAGKSCLVIGGGRVGLRKIRTLLVCGARVTVISPEVVDSVQQLSTEGKIKLHRRPYLEGDLAGAFLVFAVTNNHLVQDRIAREAAERRVLLNIVDDPERCDFHVPAQIRRGELMLTVSTGGASPALAKLIREQLGEQFDGEYAAIVDLFARIREIVLGGSDDSDANRLLFERLLKADLVGHVRAKQWGRVAAVLQGELPDHADIDALIDVLSAE